MNYYERCLKRLEDAEEISYNTIMSISYFKFNELVSTKRDDVFYLEFQGVPVPVTQQESEEIYRKAERKYELQIETREAKVLEAL